ncbi:hypothetical protein M407DRAFT_213867, partial [Tulasnella calospora MUT 4182]
MEQQVNPLSSHLLRSQGQSGNQKSFQIDLRVLQDIANGYIYARSPEEKDLPRQALDELLDKLPAEDLIDVTNAKISPWELLRKSGIPGQALQAAVELTGTSEATELTINALQTLPTLVAKIDLDADGFVFGEAVMVNLPGLATQIAEMAQQPRSVAPHIFFTLKFSRGKAVGCLITYTKIDHTYASQLSRRSFGPTGILNKQVSILDGFQGELGNLLRRYPPERVVKQMTRHLGQPKDEASFRYFCSVFTRFIRAGRQTEMSLLQRGKLHVPILNGWWAVRRGALAPAKSTYGRPSSITWHGDAVEHIYSIISATESRDIKWTVVRDLINEGDLVLLLAQLIASREGREDR